MNFKMLLLLFCFSLICFKNTEAITRTEISRQYRSTLEQIKAIADQKYKDSTEQYGILTGQIQNWIVRTKNVTQTQITNIKAIVTSAKKEALNSSLFQTCIRVPESKANSLSTVVLNPCTVNNNFTALTTCKNQFQTISAVARNTLTWCSSLNPLTTQDKPYEECLAYKIPDLNLQLNLIENQYFDLSNATLNWNQDCLAKGATTIYSAIGNINYQLNMCKVGL